MENDRVLISVVVCTYNRAHDLSRALDSLIQQTLDKRLYEVIVVDNASTDPTPEVVRDSKGGCRECNIVSLREDRLGLGYARNTGYCHARGSYVAFIDDDAKAGPDWLETAVRCFEEVRPTPLGIGGIILPCYESPKPKWFKDEYEIRTWGEQPRFLKRGECFSGSNMIFRKLILERYGGFDGSIGVKGLYLSVGEETSFFQKVWQVNAEARFYYWPRLVVFHAVPDYKMTVSYHLKRAFVTGQVWHSRNRPNSLGGKLWLLVRILLSLFKYVALALVFLRRFPAYPNWVVERFTPIATEIGRLAGMMGVLIPVRQRDQ